MIAPGAVWCVSNQARSGPCFLCLPWLSVDRACATRLCVDVKVNRQ